jgi:hypothetical protein
MVSKGLYSGMIMLDLRKAFDTVDYDILCGKLKWEGISNTDWFMSYHKGRKQTVSVDNIV